VLVLHLCWLVASAGIITAVSASVALQGSLDDVIVHGRSASVRKYFSRFIRDWRRFWLCGIIMPVVAVLYVFALLFWASTIGWPRIVSLVLLLPLGGLAFGVYLAALAATATLPSAGGAQAALRRGWVILRARPIRAAGCLILMVTWLLLLSRIPTLALVGLGLVPAFLALWLGRAPLPNGRPARD